MISDKFKSLLAAQAVTLVTAGKVGQGGNSTSPAATDLDVESAQLIADQIMAMAGMMGLEAEHQYVQGHVDKIKEFIK